MAAGTSEESVAQAVQCGKAPYGQSIASTGLYVLTDNL
jgi:hypothetical protein